VLTAFLFSIGKLALGFYLGHSGIASPYGAAGSVIVLVIWVYYSAQILFFGAEFTKVHAQRTGVSVAPSDNAVSKRGLVPAGEAMKPRALPVSDLSPQPGEVQHEPR
jgi:membrane protein